MSKLSVVQNKTIEEYWSDLDGLKKQLRYREWELLNAYQETDTNIGGGKSNRISDTTGNKAIILVEDKNYQHLKNIITTLEQLYKELDHDQKTIVNIRYFDKHEAYEWSHVADKLSMSVQRVLRKRNMLIDETARRLGWV
ncbi:transcriptional regulator [Lysinibacillus xylanilyticus]|uniref:transcriptional regulator n=1 Tax=Lysinibacillus xylanilyticus TaxID=582475 RepID=UPI003826F46A